MPVVRARRCLGIAILKKDNIGFILLLLFTLLAFVTKEAAALQVRINGDRMTLRAQNVPLHDILTGLAQDGIKARMDPHINLTVSASFQDREIQKGLELILNALQEDR